MIYRVKPVVCDYGVFECVSNKEDNLIVICNSSYNVMLVAKILNTDLNHEVWKPKESEAENE